MEEKDRRFALEERATILQDHGYCGFTITDIKRTSSGFMVSVVNSNGIELKADGESMDEVYDNAVEVIDYFTDNKQ